MIKFSDNEIRDLAKAWLVISLAFAIARTNFAAGVQLTQIAIYFMISAVVVGTAFILHELAHKFLAQRYRCWAEFRSFDRMLVLALFMSFFGFVFAAPGAVFIYGHVTKKQNGKIGAAGIIVNLALAFIFLLIIILTSIININVGIIRTIAVYGFWVNSFLAFFNLLPFSIFDGRKVMDWSKIAYGFMMLVSVGFLIASSLVK